MKSPALKLLFCLALGLFARSALGQATQPSGYNGGNGYGRNGYNNGGNGYGNGGNGFNRNNPQNDQQGGFNRRQGFQQQQNDPNGQFGGGRQRRFQQGGGFGNGGYYSNPFNSFQPASTQPDATPKPPEITSSFEILTARSIFLRGYLQQPITTQAAPIRNDQDYLVLDGAFEALDKGQAGTMVAFLEDSDTQETHVVKVGDQIAGGKVVGIHLDEMDFQSHGIVQHLEVGESLSGNQVFGGMAAAATLPSTIDLTGAGGDVLKAMALRRQHDLQGIGGGK